ncbi:hypothetical protein SKAU_G00029340 [Synaphobranchus kaupii]|uniref:DDE Tnp4 domain-containing protein n=1 Tax=Synaphobranchus kaupii TaxID=118154 RepID=A0A9Q1GDA0_SYNKA|nr:hypothetical protein SKAU_G00029340 [Synaphobranchus kaupii]
MLREIEALRQQLQTYHLQNSWGLQRFASSPEDIRFYTSLLGSVCIWMSPATVKASLPHDFDGCYNNTQVVLDCTELQCQTPSSLLLQSEVFSTYKSHCTFKAMVGMSPHGTLTFASALYEGSMSDKEVFHQSGLHHS